MGQESMYFTMYNAGSMCMGTLMAMLQLSFGYYHWQKPDKVINHLKSMSRVKTWNTVAKTFAYLTLFMYTLLSLQIATAPMIGVAPNDFHCQIRAYWGVLTYHWSKGCVYGVLIARLRMAYLNTKFSYSRIRVIYPFYALLFIYFLSTGILDTTQIVSYYESKEKWCDVDYPRLGLIGTLIFDSIFIIVCLILLIKPLHTSVNQENINNINSNDNKRNKPKIENIIASYESETGTGSTHGSRSASENVNTKTSTSGTSRKRGDTHAKFKLAIVISKYRKLAVMTLLSTIISMGFYVIASNNINNNVYIASIAGGAILIDNVISVIFAFLFDSKHDDLYDKLCVCKKNVTRIKRSATVLGIRNNIDNTNVNNADVNYNGGKIAVGAISPSTCIASPGSKLGIEKSPHAGNIDETNANYGPKRQTLSSVALDRIITAGVLKNHENNNYIYSDDDDDDEWKKAYITGGSVLGLEVIEVKDNLKNEHEKDNENENENKNETEPIPNLQNNMTQTFALSGISGTGQTEFRYICIYVYIQKTFLALFDKSL